MNIRHVLVATLAFAISAVAHAGSPGGTVPEPETMALLGMGAVALIIARWRKKK